MKRSPHSHQVPVSTIASAPRLLAAAAIDHRGVAAMAGLEPGRLATPEGRISFEEIGRYLHACVLATGDEAFALRVGLAGGPGALSTMGFVAMNTASVRGALATLARYLHRVAGIIEINDNGELACFEYSFFFPGLDGSRYICDAAIGLSLSILRNLCGRGWRLPAPLTRQRSTRCGSKWPANCSAIQTPT